jgi:lipoate-protein ligase A
MEFAGARTQVETLDEPSSHVGELAWLDDALNGRPRAVLWEGRRGLVAPLSYHRHARLDAVCAEFAAQGWNVELRRSGGGIVPQGPGILNLSLALPIHGPPGGLAERVYVQLCGVLARALARLGIDARPRAVDGSFCDGRFNLAVGERKIAGAAQYWRRAGGRQAVLAHALLLVDVDPTELAARANAFEAALGGELDYRADKLTTVARECGTLAGNASPGDLSLRLRELLAAELTREPASSIASG